MNRRSMTEGERKILEYARGVLDGPSDPAVSERIANVYRNLILRSRAHEMEEVQKNIDFLKGIDLSEAAATDPGKGRFDGAFLAFYTLLTHDQFAALSLVDRIGEKQFPEALKAALSAWPGASATLYGLWHDVTAKLSEDGLGSASAAWASVAADYCRAMMPANPPAAFAIWQQASDWNKKFPTEDGGVTLTDVAHVIISPGVKSLGRMNEALWEFVREQDEARAVSGQLGQTARIASLQAALKMTQAELAAPPYDDAALSGIWDAALPWMTDDLPGHAAWDAFELALSWVTATPRAALVPVGDRLGVVSQNWAEQHGSEAGQLIQLSESPAAWVDRPLYSTDWSELEGEAEVRGLLWRMALPGRFLAGKTQMIDRVRVSKPSFYPGQTLVEMQAQLDDGAHAICNFLISGRQPTALLFGQSPPIHAINAGGLLKRMDEEDVALEYLRFFCAHVWGESGPFRIAEVVEDVPFADSADETARGVVANIIKATPCEMKPLPAGLWEATALVCYQNALFKARFKVEPTGMVEMLEDEPLAADLPIRKIVMRDGFRLYDGVWEGAAIKTGPPAQN